MTAAITFSVRMKDVGELPPMVGSGEYVSFTSASRDVPFELVLQRLGGAAEIRTAYYLRTFGGTRAGAQIIASGLVGAFDVVEDVVWATLPPDVLNAWDPAIRVIRSGDSLTRLTGKRPPDSRRPSDRPCVRSGAGQVWPWAVAPTSLGPSPHEHRVPSTKGTITVATATWRSARGLSGPTRSSDLRGATQSRIACKSNCFILDRSSEGLPQRFSELAEFGDPPAGLTPQPTLA